MYVNGNNVRYFDSFGVEQISKEIIKSIGNKNITANIDRIQTYKYICIGFTDVMFKGRSLSEYANFFFYQWIWKEWQNNIKIFSIEFK